MKLKLIQMFLLLCCSNVYAQISVNKQPTLLGFFIAKEFSKEMSLYNAKTFVMQTVLGKSDGVIKFQLDALVAANSGELTTLVYKCESENKEGLILGFYGNRWNDAGVTYSAYTFKDLPIKSADSLLSLIENSIENNYKYLDADADNNNIYFRFNDIAILAYKSSMITKLRVYWNGFDSEWNWNEFKKTKTRLVKKLK